MNERSGVDRRVEVRFEIVTELWGFLAALERVDVHDISPHGALVEAPWPMAVGGIHHVRLTAGPQIAEIRARVRHVRPPIPGGRRYLIGLEFLDVGHGPLFDAAFIAGSMSR